MALTGRVTGVERARNKMDKVMKPICKAEATITDGPRRGKEKFDSWMKRQKARARRRWFKKNLFLGETC